MIQMKKYSRKPRAYKSKIIDDLLSEITPEEQKIMDRKMLLAARIDEAMKAKGMRNVDLAKALKVQPSVVTKWLSGTHNFTTETLWEIGNILGVEFINLEENKHEAVIYMRKIYVSQQTESVNWESLLLSNLQPLGPKQKFQLASN